MKIYDIYDEANKMSVGTLIYYEKPRSYIIELQNFLDEWTAPLLFTGLVKRNIYTVSKELSQMWVKERVIPSGRQNIDSILKNHNLKEYDEMRFLELSKGKCSQDSLCIRRIDTLPYYVLERQKKNLAECTILNDRKILCFFNDKSVRKVDLHELKKIPGVDKVLLNDDLFKSGQVDVGGYSVTFNESIDIAATDLYKAGEEIPLTLDDFKCFVDNNVLDSGECCNVLKCSRQNLNYMCNKEQIISFKNGAAGNLYLKGDALKSMWD